MSVKEVARCTGHCCKDFCLPHGPDQITHWKRATELGKNPFIDRGRYASSYEHDDIVKVSQMLIFKRVDRQGSGHARKRGKTPDLRYHYTCRWFDAQSGNCMNYEERPNMCRDYACSEGPCHMRGCTKRVEHLPCKKLKVATDSSTQ